MTCLFKTPQDFGAVGDGVTDDKVAFQCAIDSGYPVAVPWTPTGYLISTRLRMTDGATILGADKAPVLKLGSSGEWLFEIVGSDVTIKNLKGAFGHLASGGFCLLRSDQASFERPLIEDIMLTGASGIIHDLGGSGTIVFLQMRRIKSYGTRGRGINLSRSFAYQHAEQISVLYNGIANPHIGVCQVGNEGSFWSACDVTCGMVTMELSGAHGFYFQNCKAVWMRDCMADMVGGGGFFLDGGNNFIYMRDCIASMVGTHGFSIVNNGPDITLAGCKVGGRKGMPYSPSMPGIYCYNTSYLIVDDACRTYNMAGGSGIGFVNGGASAGVRDNAMHQ